MIIMKKQLIKLIQLITCRIQFLSLCCHSELISLELSDLVTLSCDYKKNDSKKSFYSMCWSG